MKNLDKTKDDEVKKVDSKENLDASDDQEPEKNDDIDSEEEFNDDAGDDESYGSRGESRNTSGVKDKKLKSKQGGVNGGRDKRAANAQAAISNAKAVNSKAMIRTGPASDPDCKKRTKERTITEIIEKVSTWRKLYNGEMIPNKETKEVQLQRWSLEDAAKKVNVSKKSLDDYLLQLRFGKKFGFDFEKHRESKVGVLRSFVKEEKDKLKKANGNQKVSSKSPLKDESS